MIGLVLDIIPEATELDMSADHDLIGRSSGVTSDVAVTGLFSANHVLIDRSSDVPGQPPDDTSGDQELDSKLPTCDVLIDYSSTVISTKSVSSEEVSNSDVVSDHPLCASLK